jgi:flavodoxin
MKVLVAVGSRHGSTRGIAELIAADLRVDRGVDAVLRGALFPEPDSAVPDE